jgi:hypothetical protein
MIPFRLLVTEDTWGSNLVSFRNSRWDLPRESYGAAREGKELGECGRPLIYLMVRAICGLPGL